MLSEVNLNVVKKDQKKKKGKENTERSGDTDAPFPDGRNCQYLIRTFSVSVDYALSC